MSQPSSAQDRFVQNATKVTATPTRSGLKKYGLNLAKGLAIGACACVLAGIGGYSGTSTYGVNKIKDGLQDNLVSYLERHNYPTSIAEGQPHKIHIADTTTFNGTSLFLALREHKGSAPTNLKKLARVRAGHQAYFHPETEETGARTLAIGGTSSETTMLASMAGDMVKPDQIDVSQDPLSPSENRLSLLLHEIGHNHNDFFDHKTINEAKGSAKFQLAQEQHLRLEGTAENYFIRSFRDLGFSDAPLYRRAMARTLHSWQVFPTARASDNPDFKTSFTVWEDGHHMTAMNWKEMREGKPLELVDRIAFSKTDRKVHLEMDKRLNQIAQQQGGFKQDVHPLAQLGDWMVQMRNDALQNKQASDLNPMIAENAEYYVRSVNVLTPSIGAQMQQDIPADWKNMPTADSWKTKQTATSRHVSNLKPSEKISL